MFISMFYLMFYLVHRTLTGTKQCEEGITIEGNTPHFSRNWGDCCTMRVEPFLGLIRPEFYLDAPCHSFSLKMFYVFEQTVTPLDAPIICTYLEYMRKNMPPFNFDSDRICSLG